jgi:dynein heavy chain
MHIYLVDQKRLQQMERGLLNEQSYQAYETAVTAVDDLPAKHVQELKSLGRPPHLVEDVLAAVGYLVTDTKRRMNWADAQKLMSDPSRFVQTVQCLDLDSITADTLQQIQPITSLEDFTVEVMTRRSTAAAVLCQWVLAVQEYAENVLGVPSVSLESRVGGS